MDKAVAKVHFVLVDLGSKLNATLLSIKYVV